ncbi:MAG: nucleotide exchange factor GrpE [Actinomycetota bacterium]|nr:nucleotide exchange factor GrpE [Actinomycetota bacterium]
MSDNGKVASSAEATSSADHDPADTAEVDVVEGEVVEAEVIEPGRLQPADLGLILPDDPDEARTVLLTHLGESRAEADEYLETLQRVAADFENYRRRVERDQAETVGRAASRIVEALLPSLDAFEAALAYEPQTPGEHRIMDGLRSTHDQLMVTLGREGLERIPSTGQPFDPAVHEAVAGGGDGDLVVTADLRRGYTLRGRVIRPTLVTVGHQD